MKEITMPDGTISIIGTANEKYFKRKLRNRIANTLAQVGYKSLSEVKEALINKEDMFFDGTKIVISKELIERSKCPTSLTIGAGCSELIDVLGLTKEEITPSHIVKHKAKHIQKCIKYLTSNGYKVLPPTDSKE